MDSISRIPIVDAEAPKAAGGREKGRDSLFLMAQLVIAGDRTPRDVRVRNLSAGGLMVEVAKPVDEGTPVTLTLRGIGEVKGKVAWWTQGRVGISFDEPIDPLLARKPVGNGPKTPSFAKPALR